MSAKYVMCIANGGNLISLTLRRVYKVIPDDKAEKRKMIRLIDETGGEYLFSAGCFIPVQIAGEAEETFDLVVA